MYNLNSKIFIEDPTGLRPQIHLYGVVGVSIKKSWKNLTDTCTVKLPRNLKVVKKRLDTVIANGDKITVWLGYDDELYKEFEGYIKEVRNTTPIELVCEDLMYALKKGTVTKSWPTVSLNDVLRYIYPSGDIKVLGAFDAVPFAINKDTPAQVLQYINKTYGLHCFFRQGVLCVGNVYDPDTQATHYFHFQKNIISNALEYKNAADTKIKVKAINYHIKGNTKEEYEAGDADGEERTLHYYGETTANFKQYVNSTLKLLKYDGYRGSFKCFGAPSVEHGDIISLAGVNHQLSIGENAVSDNSGEYYCDEVSKQFDFNGYRQEIVLGAKATISLNSI